MDDTVSAGAVATAPPPRAAPVEPQRFDFRGPGRAVRDGIRRLEAAHEAFAEQFVRRLNDAVGISVRLQLRSVEQMSYAHFLRDLGTPAALVAFGLDPLPGRMIFELSSPVGLSIVETMLGGDPEQEHSRRPTALERRLLASVTEIAGEALAHALEPLGLEPSIVATDADPHLLGVHRGEVVLEDAGWGCPAECSVGSVVIVEMHEPGVGARASNRPDAEVPDRTRVSRNASRDLVMSPMLTPAPILPNGEVLSGREVRSTLRRVRPGVEAFATLSAVVSKPARAAVRPLRAV